MNRFSRSLAMALALAPVFFAASAQAQYLTDYATTPDQHTVGATFDAQGAAAASGSTLESDYNALLAGGASDITASTQSLLPTTAYSVTGVANSVANVEETNIMGRLRALRSKELASVRQNVARAATEKYITPLQDNGEALHDLRTGNKAPDLSGGHATTNNFRMVSPLIYKSGYANTETDPNPTMAERTYNETMRLSTIGAGVPNATARETDTPKVRNVPNMADRAATNTLKVTSDLGGQGRANDTSKSIYPRYPVIRINENDKASNSLYRGQPLSSLAASDPSIPVPLTPAPQTASVYNTAPPVIYGAGEQPPIVDTNPPVLELAPPPAAAPVQPVFKYKKIDQSKTLTTPMIGSPASSSIVIKQPNTYAMPAFTTPNNLTLTTPPRAPTEAGTLLWTNNSTAKAEPEAAKEPKATAEQVVYGTTAVPLTGINADRRWGFFVSGDTGFGSDALQANSAKTKTNTTGFTAGADYRIADTSFIGLALTYAHTSFTTGSYGDLQGNSAALSLYGTTSYLKDAYVDGYISMGYHSLESERTLFASGSTIGKATSSPDGYQFTGKAETGYDFKNAAWTYGPFTGFRLAYADFGSYTEKDAGNFNLKVRGLDSLSAIGTLGVGGSYRVAMAKGGILLPSLRAGYNHEFGDDRSEVKAEFANLASSSFTTKGEKKSRDWLSLAPSVSAALPNDWTFVAHYEHDFFRDDSNENIFNLAANYKW